MSTVRAWLNQGLAAHRSGDLTRAAGLYRQALLAAPANQDALNLLGTALLQLGNAADALPLLQQAARGKRNDARVLANLAQCHMALGRHDAAADTFRKAARIEPKLVDLQLGLGSALALQGKLDEAHAVLQRAAQRAPESAAIHLNLGHVARDRRRFDEAIDHYKRAAAIDPALPDALNGMGSALHAQLRFAEAEAAYRQCIQVAPDHFLARFNLASVLIDRGAFAASEIVARELVAQLPDSAEAHGLLGSALGLQHRLAEAQAEYARAHALAPDDLKTCETLAASTMEIGRAQEGLRLFCTALALGEDAPGTRQLLAGALLADGAVHDGLREYRARHDAVSFREKHPSIPIAQKRLPDLRDLNLCVIAEQGLGDELFFLRYAESLANAGARLTYVAGGKIAPLVARLPFLSRVTTTAEPLPDADAYVLVADLPHLLNEPAATALPARPANLRCIAETKRRLSIHIPPVPRSAAIAPLRAIVERVRERLAALGPPPYIGLTWRAGVLPEQQSSANWVLYKEIALPHLANALDGVAATIVALQRQPAHGELSAISDLTGRVVHDLSALNDDLEAMLALLSVIDEYIGVSNTNMHLRAAAGRTARVLVPAPGEWRWLRAGGESPWFPGFVVYRQSLSGDWTAAVQSLRADLLSGTGPRAADPGRS